MPPMRVQDARMGPPGLSDPAVQTHLLVLALIVVATVLLEFWPTQVMALNGACLFRSVLHIKCPFCGMTRDFAAILHGHQPKFNPFSWAAAAVAYVLYPGVFLWAWRKRRLDVFYLPVVTKTGLAGLVVMFVVNNLFS